MNKPEMKNKVEFLKEHPHTVVLHYQPEGFILLKEPADLRRWEVNMREKVGLRGLNVDFATESGCDTITGGIPDACDTD
jgi:hypothetical protein